MDIPWKATKTGEEISEFAASLKYDDLTDKVKSRAKRVVLDSVSTILAGRDWLDGDLDKFAPYADEANIIGGKSTDAGSAAFYNTAYAQVHDFNDGLNSSGVYSSSYHPGRVLVPTALAAAQKYKKGGADVMAALVVGYEVAARMRNPKLYTAHYADTFAAGAVAAKLMGGNAREIKNAMSMAAYMCPTRNGDSTSDGSETNFLGFGACSRAGILGAEFAMNGMKGPEFNDNMNFTQRFSVRGLGQKLYIMDIYFKPFPACRKTHHAIINALRFRDEFNVKPEDIKEIEIFQQKAGMYVDQMPDETFNYKRCQFSLQFLTATAFVDGKVDIDSFRDLRRPEVIELAHKIKVTADEGLDGACDTRPNHGAMNVTLSSGKILSLYEPYPLGSEPNQTTDKQAAAKLFHCMGERYAQAKKEEVLERIWGMDR